MNSRVRFAVRSLIAACALFGITSASILIFAPQLIAQFTNGFTAYGLKGYQLPKNSEPSPNSAADIKVLETFSNVFVNIANQARAGLVYILTETPVPQSRSPFPFPDDFFFPFFPPGPGGGGRHPKQRGFQEGAGSGFLVDLKNGYVATNSHVVKGATKVKVITFDERQFEATVLGADESVDVAVLKLQNFTPRNLKPLSFGNSDLAKMGEWVLALGAPYQLPNSASLGIVSAKGRGSEIGGLENSYADFIQTDAAINPGNSGGPLLNIHGKVIGMNTAIITRSASSAGIGLAIPSNWVVSSLEMLINNNGKVVRGFLGVSLSDVDQLSPDVKKQLDIPDDTQGSLIRQVVKGSPADKAGLKPYDVIVGIKDQNIRNSSQLRNTIAFTPPGSRVALNTLRDGKKREVEVTVGELSNASAPSETDSPSMPSQRPKTPLTQFGIEVVPLTKDLAAEYNLKTDSGLLVTRIIPGSIASGAESLQPRDVILEVNKKRVRTLEQLSSAMKSTKNRVLLLVERGNGTMLIVLSL